MPEGLKLVAENTDDDIEKVKLDKQMLQVRCKLCGHRYLASIGEIIDNPECRKCGR